MCECVCVCVSVCVCVCVCVCVRERERDPPHYTADQLLFYCSFSGQTIFSLLSEERKCFAETTEWARLEEGNRERERERERERRGEEREREGGRAVRWRVRSTRVSGWNFKH